MSDDVRAASDFATSALAEELSLFDRMATGWKAYWASFVRPYVRGRVLEVGAGNGGSISYLLGDVTDWLCLEPDPTLAVTLKEQIESGKLPPICTMQIATLSELSPERQFDTILYIDVMEHLADDGREAALAARHLSAGGCLIVLSPAHQFLFSPFDQAVGHYRRYSRTTLAAIAPASLEQVVLIYLDSAGMLLSLGNRFVLRSVRPNEASLRFWNDWIIPASRRLDRLFGYAVGKSVLGVWRKPDEVRSATAIDA
jgi:2-polyprenyl-3-methyl-5-hydroxy-6-metoxy-1,4-benzoquinol methylase